MSVVCPLFSGSAGNCIFIKSEKLCFLIDAGRSCRQIERYISDNGFNPNDVKFILVTHEHIDHIKGLDVFARHHKTRVLSSKGTIDFLETKGILNNKIDYNSIDFSGTEIDGIRIVPFDISHDCVQGFGYSIFLKNNIKISICSDIGYISDSVFESLIGSNILIIESNHDIEMLKNGPYPKFLKKRILSDKGHLSNSECHKVLQDLVKTGVKKIILCHLSEINNTPEIAYNSALSAIQKLSDCEIYVAPKENTSNLKIVI